MKKSSIVKKEFGKSWDKVSDPQDSANVCCEFLRGIVIAFPKVVHRTLCSQEHLEGQNLGRFCIRDVIIGLGYTRINVLGSFHLNLSPHWCTHTPPPQFITGSEGTALNTVPLCCSPPPVAVPYPHLPWRWWSALILKHQFPQSCARRQGRPCGGFIPQTRRLRGHEVIWLAHSLLAKTRVWKPGLCLPGPVGSFSTAALSQSHN